MPSFREIVPSALGLRHPKREPVQAGALRFWPCSRCGQNTGTVWVEADGSSPLLVSSPAPSDPGVCDSCEREVAYWTQADL